MRIFLVAAIVLFTVFSYGVTNSEAVEKIGYVNLSKTFDEYQKTIDYEGTLKGKREKGQTELNNMVEKIKGMRQEMDLLSDEAKQAKQAEIDDKVKDLQRLERDLRDDLRRERASMTRDILTEMKEVIEKYGEKEGYSLILDDKVLLYSDSSLDVTDQIIKILNKNYKH